MNRDKPPSNVDGFIHKIVCHQNGEEFNLYLNPSFYPDSKRLCLLFIKVGKQSGELQTMLTSMLSYFVMLIQCGYPLDELAAKMAYRRGDHEIFTDDKDVPHASSLIDLIGKWLLRKKEKGEIE